MRHPHKVEKQNKGFSLVEVLVTLAVICILSIPVIQNFIRSSKTNKNARNIQNAVDVAQSTSEYFDAMSMDSLKINYINQYSTINNDVILFKNIGDGIHTDTNGNSYFLGADNEVFYVSVILDPSGYTGEESNPGMNDYNKPNIHNLNENSSITCRGKLDQYDRNIVNAFKQQYGIDVQKKYIVKESTFRIEQQKSTQYTNKIEYRYFLDLKYTYEGKLIRYDNIILGIGILDSSEIKAPNLYIIYTPLFAMYGESPTSNDKINIEYRTGNNAQSWEKPVNIYLVQQDAYFGGNTDNTISLNKNNINIKCYSGTNNSISGTGSFDNNQTDKINFFTNVAGWDVKSSLTYGEDKLDKLYTMSVYVWKDNPNGIKIEDDKILTSGDYYTVVTNVKEG